MKRPLVIIESPFAASPQHSHDEHLQYLRKCLRHSWAAGELPFASHALFPLFLNESDPAERELGIEAGYEFWDFVNDDDAATPLPLIAFYCDFGISPGMARALERTTRLNRRFAFRFALS